MIRAQQTQKALGSDIVLTVVLADGTDSEQLFADLWREIRLFEATFSRFQPDSELTFVNQRAGTPTPVSEEFIQLVEVAKHYAEQSDGLYNPFILPQLQAAGYKGSWPAPETFDLRLDYSRRKVADVSSLVISKNSVLIPADTALDFGGIGKGYLLDSLATQLTDQKVENYWLSLGGDIICAGRDADGSPWRVGIQSALEDAVLTTVENTDGQPLAIATSGVTKRRGEKWHHLIDPRTGKSAATDTVSSTVITSRAVEADIYAKCAVILGSRAAPAFLQQRGVESYALQIQQPKNKLQLVQTGKAFI